MRKLILGLLLLISSQTEAFERVDISIKPFDTELYVENVTVRSISYMLTCLWKAPDDSESYHPVTRSVPATLTGDGTPHYRLFFSEDLQLRDWGVGRIQACATRLDIQGIWQGTVIHGILDIPLTWDHSDVSPQLKDFFTQKKLAVHEEGAGGGTPVYRFKNR